MADVRKVAVLVGSLRKESFNRKMALALAAMAPPTLKLEIVEIGELPHYNQDLDPDHPPAHGEVGKVGVPVPHLGDMRSLFDGLPLDEMNTSMTINATAV